MKACDRKLGFIMLSAKMLDQWTIYL